MEPSIYDQLQGKKNARAWKRQFKVAALSKGVWDVFTGVFQEIACPDLQTYGLHLVHKAATSSAATSSAATSSEAKEDEAKQDEQTDKKGKRKSRATLGPGEISELLRQSATATSEQRKGTDFTTKMTLYKFELDEYDKSRKILSTAMALLITWVHTSLRGQLEDFDQPKAAYDHLVERYSVSDARAREMAENLFNSIYITRYATAQDYINAIENASRDIVDAGGYCDDPMIISKIIRGLRGNPLYRDFATQYHLLRDIDSKFEELDHVITQLLTYESSIVPEPDMRGARYNNYGNSQSSMVPEPDMRGARYNNYGNSRSNPRNNFTAKQQRERCTACGIYGHIEEQCMKTHPELRPQNNGYFKQQGRSNYNRNNAVSGNRTQNGLPGNGPGLGTKPNGMVATVMVDKEKFTSALHRAKANSASSTPTLEGTTSLTRVPQNPAKDLSQANSLRKVQGKGELEGEISITVQGKGVREFLPELFCRENQNSTVITTEDVEIAQPNTKCNVADNVTPLTHMNSLQPYKVSTEAEVDEKVCLATNNAPVHPDAWILDSGANVYVCNNHACFKSLYTFTTIVNTAGQGSAMPIVGGGVVELMLKDEDGDPFKLTLNDVAFAPTSRCSLLSISKLAQAGIHGSWESGGDQMKLQSGGFVIGNAKLDGGLYHLQLSTSSPMAVKPHFPFAANVDFDDPVWKEHRRLGHLNLQRMIALCDQSTGMNVTKGQIQVKLGQICPICATARAIVKIPRDPARVRYEAKGELVHVDIWGPYAVVGWDGTRWMCFVTDDATRETKTLRLKTLTELPEKLRTMHRQEERTYQITIKRYRVDNQLNQGPWKDWCVKKGIAIEPVAPYAHHQVGVAERANRTLREGASAMIQDQSIGGQIRKIIEQSGHELLRNTNLPENTWPEAMDYAAWLKNRTPTRAVKLKKTPWELTKGSQPDLSREKTWGSRVYVSYTDEERGRKLHDPRGWVGYFVGCENESIYRVWDPEKGRVRRVTYTVVEDGHGLNDNQVGQLFNGRTARHIQPGAQDIENSEYTSDENNDDEWSEPGEQDYPVTRETGRVSRYFATPAAMVTTRDKKPLPHEDVTSNAFEEVYVPPLGTDIRGSNDLDDPFLDAHETAEASPYFTTPSRPAVRELTASPYYSQTPERAESPLRYKGSSKYEGDDTDLGDVFQDLERDEDIVETQLENEDDTTDYIPMLPTRDPTLTTANQLPLSESESENDSRCANELCRTPKSLVRATQVGPDGKVICVACMRRYKRQVEHNVSGDQWKQPREIPYPREKTKPDIIRLQCSNELCKTPKSPVRASQIGPEGEVICGACLKRYQRQIESDVPNDSEGWKVPGGNPKKKPVLKPRTKPIEEPKPLTSDDSEEDVPLRPKRDRTRDGIRISKRVPDRDKCQTCFDQGTNCDYANVQPCSVCTKYRRRCKPLELGPNDELPATRRYSKVPVRHIEEHGLENKCYQCRVKQLRCDAELPIDHRNPCTSCKKNNSYCCSWEQKQRMKDLPACSSCAGHGKVCNREQPCNICIEQTVAKCSYTSQDGTRVITVLTNPVSETHGVSNHDANIDRFNPDERRGCIQCRAKYKAQDQRSTCTFIPGGPPCEQCFKSTSRNTDRCTSWTEPGRIESVKTRMFKRDEESGELIRDPEKEKNKRTAKRPRGEAREYLSASETDTSRVDIYGEESRAATRQKLANVKLPDIFLSAMSMATFLTPIDNALRPDPQSYTEAMKSPDAQKWREAIQVEYDSLLENGTWKVVDLPPGRKALTTKWVLKKKLGPNGEILKYKARMVARGFQQVEGYDYTETYSGVVKAAAYRLLFALMTLCEWTCHQMDVVTAFLNGEVFEEIYIHPPQGYPHPQKVLRLLKALYGLKQSPRLWYRKLRQWLLSNGWEISKYDECVFYNYSRGLIITVYVDDINIFGPSDEHITPFKKEIAKAFKMTDAGRAAWYLGMQLDWRPEGIHVHQNGFAQQALGRYGLLGSRPANVPLDPTRKLVKETETTADPKFKTAYMSMIGSLNYLQTKTAWALAFPVSLLSRFMSNPNQTHMDAAIQEFRYVSSHSECGLYYQKDGDRTLRGFVDSDWGGDTDTGKSTTGWVFTLANSPISWSSRQQRDVSSSSTEAEYVAASDACKEALWLKGFHNEIVTIMSLPQQESIPLAIDNASALKLSKNPEFHGRTKHINIRHHFIRECVERGEIIPSWISGKENPADLFTKALGKTLFQENVRKLGGGMPASSTSAANNDRIVDV